MLIMLAGLAPEERHVYSNWLMRHVTGFVELSRKAAQFNEAGETFCQPFSIHMPLVWSYRRPKRELDA